MRPSATLLPLFTTMVTMCPGALRAQTVEALQQRADRLRALIQETRADSARTKLDTVTAGQLIIATDWPDHSAIVQAGTLAWTKIAAQFGPDTAILGSQMIVLMGTSRRRNSAEWGNANTVGLSGWETPPDIANRVVEHVNNVAISIGRLRAWLGSRPRLDTLTAADWSSLYVLLATSQVALVRSCLDGAVGDCTKSLGLQTSATPNIDWYTLDEARWMWASGRRGRCERERSDRECLDWLASEPPKPPLEPTARTSVVRYALAVGGPGAFGRLVRSEEADPESALAAAAGQPLDSLVRGWRTNVVAHRPPPTALTRKSAWMALFWIFALVSLSTRSPRWGF